jgi:hypothetical protein
MLLIVPLLTLAACGSNPSDDGVASAGGSAISASSASPQGKLDPKDAAVKYAQCMRANGVEYPDPGTKQDRQGVRVTDAFIKADRTCKTWHEASSDYLAALVPEVMDGKRKYAQCMRERGMKVSDPDPNTGSYRVDVTDKDKDKFLSASNQCKHYLLSG